MIPATSQSALTLDTAALHFAESGEPHLRFGGALNATAHVPTAIALVGARLALRGALEEDGDRWSADVALLTSRWGGPKLAPPSGRYRVELAGVHAAELATATSTTTPVAPAAPSADTASLAEPTLVDGVCVVEVDLAAATVEFSAPLAEAERGPAQQARLEAVYRSGSPTPLDAVFFESFYGQNASCNPLAIDREIAASHPTVARYWSVADASVAVPDGAIAIIDGSEEWWRIRGGARLLVVNDWLRKRFRRRSHQTVLQTWHGTPLKRIALTRRGLRPRAALATLLERARWDNLLSQNTYSSRIFRTAYAFGRPWELGYPRNDVLVGDVGAQRAVQLREKLGVPHDATVVLYAPTWRDDHPEEVDQLDVAAFTRELGEGYFTLIRGHSRTLRAADDVHAANVLDVTSYPDASDLFLVADALVTDYSSVMFDFTVTGKPLYFYTPDLDRYRDELRGFYFDLLAVSPGPVAQTAAQLIEHLRAPEKFREQFAHRYAAWSARFNAHDDGHAAERVVQRLVDKGAIG
jgi:CDP-glycerol glycerophosphotransferase